jgi:predicted dehydrogenase
LARSKIRIGLIGYGNWGKRIYETLCTFPNIDVSIIEKNAFASHCDAVIIATPSTTHAELALNYLEKKFLHLLRSRLRHPRAMWRVS